MIWKLSFLFTPLKFECRRDVIDGVGMGSVFGTIMESSYHVMWM